mmetsp:Transcript_8658/g.18385  ORF Transcript_8658/g.18385 Transcript_8658/m.18385 type:complete len:241 (+) Transcript_8658:1169-1891(+)
MFATDDLRMCSSRLRSFSLILSTRISFRRSRYWICPLDRVLCWILIFSYNSASSSLRRMSCVPRMSRSLTTMSYSFFWRMRSWSASLMMWFSFSISAFCEPMAVSASLICCFALLSSMRSPSFSFSTFMWSKCSLTSARSLAVISSLSCSIWCCMILNLRFISWISSCASIRFLLYRLRSARTASYRFCCCFSLPSPSLMRFCRSMMAISRSLTSSRACMYLAAASDASMAYFSLSFSSW